MFSHIEVPIAAGVIAFVYAVVLTEPDMLLAPWYRFIHKLVFKCRNIIFWHPSCTYNCEGSPKHYRPLHNKIAVTILKLLIDCDRCIAGQLTLWWYLFTVRPYNFMQHLFFVCIAIFVPIIMNKIYRECRK